MIKNRFILWQKVKILKISVSHVTEMHNALSWNKKATDACDAVLLILLIYKTFHLIIINNPVI